MPTLSSIYASLLLAIFALTNASASENYEFNEEGKLGVGSSFQNGSAVCMLNGAVYKLQDGYVIRSPDLTGKLNCIIEGKTAFEGKFKQGTIEAITLYTSDFKRELGFEAKANGGYQITQFDALGKTPSSRISYDSQKRENGVSQYFYDNGKIQNDFTFVAGKKNGKSTYYDEKGNPLKIEWFQNDVLLLSYGLIPGGTLKSAIECSTVSVRKIEFSEPMQLCGHGKPSSLEIHDTETKKVRERIRFDNGVAVLNEILGANSKVKERSEINRRSGCEITTQMDDAGLPKQSEAFPIELRDQGVHRRGKRVYRVNFVDGKISRISCGQEIVHGMKPDYCGFDGPFKTPLYERDPGTKKIKLIKTMVMKNGREQKS